jgi:MYXO-CTERM domain-containing protein
MWKGSAYVFRHALGSGSACTLAAECLSGECSEGVCCDEACAAECRSCLARNKASGPDGECGLVRAGTDPRDSCDAEDESTCGRTGTCDGSGACALYPSGTECVVSSCASSMSEDPRDTCDGSGTCEASPERDCAPGYACLSDACRPTCVSDVDCDVAGGYACRGGECKRGENGEPCSEATECESAHCVDGVCCDRPCEDQCEACAEPTDPGNCIAVIGAPRGEREACAEGPAGEPCLDTACDGESRTACAAFAGPSVICASAACVDDQATPAARCDGEGACPATEPVACGAYRCDATACKTSCDSDADCAPGSGCDLNDRCVSGSTCSADGTKAIDSLGNEKSCNPYRCELGQCGESCTASSACATGFACNPSNNQCEKVVEPAAADDGGCGCRASGGSPRRAWLAWLVGAVLVARRRRTRLPPP